MTTETTDTDVNTCGLCLIVTEQRDRAWQHLHDLYFDQEVERRLSRRWWWPFGRTRQQDHRFVDSICIFCEYDIRKDECLNKPFALPACLPRPPSKWRKSLDEAERRIAVYQSDVDGLRTDLDEALRKIQELDGQLELAQLQRRRATSTCETAADLMRKLDLMEDTDGEQGRLRAQLSDMKLYLIPEEKL